MVVGKNDILVKKSLQMTTKRTKHGEEAESSEHSKQFLIDFF
jgi:hypothetical protein